MTTEGHDPGTERPVETRLRHALAARADTIGPRDLRPARPPVPQPRRGLRSAVGHWTRRFALPLAAAATAAAVACGYAALTPDGPPARPSPASSPTPVPDSPTPSPTPSVSTPSANPSAPNPSRTPDPRRLHRPSATPTDTPGRAAREAGKPPSSAPTSSPPALPTPRADASTPGATARPSS